MAVNHETGIIQPLENIVEIVHRAGAWLHVDAVQALGKLSPSSWKYWDSVSLGAHKIRGPKGIGALAWKCGRPVPKPILIGGAQERGLRAGTVDPVNVAGFGAALQRVEQGPTNCARLAPLRDKIESALGPKVERNTAGDATRLGHVASLFVQGWSAEELVAALDLEGVCISSGSACAAGTAEISPVLTAMLGTERARSSVRVSLGETTTDADIQQAIGAFQLVLSRP
jgi:cysteine desulfurase